MPAEPAAYRPVIVIPVYNHPATVEDVVRRLLSTGTPVLLVDDASDPPAQEACERCRAMGADLVRRRQLSRTLPQASQRPRLRLCPHVERLSRPRTSRTPHGRRRCMSGRTQSCAQGRHVPPARLPARRRLAALRLHRTRQTRRIRIRVTRAPHVDGTSPARASRRSQTARRRRLPLPARARHAPHRRHERQALHHHAHEAPRRADLPFHGLVARPGTRLRAPSSTSVQESIR